VVRVTDAVADPRAMMIHLQNALLANSAMVRSDGFAVVANRTMVRIFIFVFG
jgi:hypothetical protein